MVQVIARVSDTAMTALDDKFASTNKFPVEAASNNAAETTVTGPADEFVNVFVTVYEHAPSSVVGVTYEPCVPRARPKPVTDVSPVRVVSVCAGVRDDVDSAMYLGGSGVEIEFCAAPVMSEAIKSPPLSTREL